MPAIAHQNKILGNTSGGGSTILVTTSESTLYGQTVTLSDGTTTLTGTFSNAGECEFTGVMMVGTLTTTSGTASTSINVPYFGVYSIILSLFSATITATYPDDKGATCTCTGNGESYTASGSPYTFTVHGAGEYRVTATLDGKSITDVIQITTDGQSETATINFGTIVVTYDNAFRGLPITCTKDSSVYTKTAPSSGNTMYFYPNIAGNWVISGTVSGTPYSKTANVTSLSTSVSVSLETVPDGKTATPTDDIEKWLACGQITGKSYTTLSQVLADAETYERLLSDSNACDYMARSTTWASTICADADAMMRLGKYDYACDALLADSTWADAITGSAYIDYVVKPMIPTMTDNTHPSGTASCGSHNADQDAYRAFDGNSSTYWNPLGTDGWVQYDFGKLVTACKVHLVLFGNSGGTFLYQFKIQGSTDGETFTDIASGSVTMAQNATGTSDLTFSGAERYRYFRYIGTRTGFDYGSQSSGVVEMQLYGETTPQTDIIVTAHGGDTVYYMDNGSPVTLTTADSDTGIGTVDWSLLPKGAITLYSSTAKNPSDLTADYSKTVYVNENTTQIYLMPDNALYWYGYEGADLEDCTTANGWQGYSNYTFTAPTRNSYSLSCSASSSNYVCIGKKTPITDATIKSVVKGDSIGSGTYGSLEAASIKSTINNNFVNNNITDNSIHLKSISITNAQTGYPWVGAYNNRACTIYALLYEIGA